MGMFLEHGHWLDLHGAGVGTLLHPYLHVSDPGGALAPSARAEAPGEAMWLTLAILQWLLVLALVVGGITLVRRGLTRGDIRSSSGRTRSGFLGRSEARRAMGERAARRAALHLHPSLSPQEQRRLPITDLAIPLGRCQGVPVYANHEDFIVVLAGMRQGKTTGFLAPVGLSWRGPMVFTTTKPADLEFLLHPPGVDDRPTVLFNPEGLGGLAGARYDPVWGCESTTTARLQAQAILAQQRARRRDKGVDWAFLAEKLLKYLLHAAALEAAAGRGNGGMSRVVEWASAQDHEAAGVTRALEGSPEAFSWAELLRELGRCAPETLYSIKINLHEALACWEDPEVVRRMSAGEPLDPARLVAGRGRLFVLASGEGHTTPLVTAMVSAVVEAAKDMARSRMLDRGRLDPPLGLLLDEATKVCPLPQLPTLVSDGGSQGIVSIVVLQSLEQGERAWGSGFRTMWGAANVHVVMGKVSDRETLEAIEVMSPEVQVEERRRGRDRHGELLDPVVRHVPALSGDEVRAISAHTGVVFAGRLPMRVELPRVDSRRSPMRDVARAAAAGWQEHRGRLGRGSYHEPDREREEATA